MQHRYKEGDMTSEKLRKVHFETVLKGAVASFLLLCVFGVMQTFDAPELELEAR